MTQLKRKKLISHDVFGIFYDYNRKSGSISFGKYEERGILKGHSLTLLHTIDQHHWSVYAQNFNFDGHEIGINQKKMIIDPMASNIYMPEDDF